jgi:type IV secretion system protein TrbL
MGGPGVIDGFLATFTQYIDSGFGLVQGDVRWLASVLIAVDITLAGLFWAMAPDEDVLARLIRKTLYIGVFAFIIGHYNNLAQIIYNSFAGLGLKAGGGTITAAQLLQPGKLAQVGIDSGKPILTSISGLMGFTSFFDNFVQIAILMIAWLIVVISFFIMAIQLFVSLIEFKLTTLAGFVLVPFGLFGRTAFLAEKVLGNVVSSGVKILALAVIVGIGSTIFGQFTTALNNPPTISDALTLILAALTLLGLSIFGPGIANGLIAGGPQLGTGAAVGTGFAAAGMGAAGVGLAAAGVGLAAAGVGAANVAGGAIGGAARGGVALAGATTNAYRAGGMAGVAEAAGSAAMSPLRSAAASMQSSFAASGVAVSGGDAASSAAGGAASAEGAGPPAWARRMKRNQTISRGVAAANHAVRSGDHPASGGGVDLSEGE